VCVCLCACMRVCMCMCLCAYMRACMRAHMRAEHAVASAAGVRAHGLQHQGLRARVHSSGQVPTCGSPTCAARPHFSSRHSFCPLPFLSALSTSHVAGGGKDSPCWTLRRGGRAASPSPPLPPLSSSSKPGWRRRRSSTRTCTALPRPGGTRPRPSTTTMSTSSWTRCECVWGCGRACASARGRAWAMHACMHAHAPVNTRTQDSMHACKGGGTHALCARARGFRSPPRCVRAGCVAHAAVELHPGQHTHACTRMCAGCGWRSDGPRLLPACTHARTHARTQAWGCGHAPCMHHAVRARVCPPKHMRSCG